MLNLYITRHGETEWNREGRLQGWQNSPLTEKGIAQGKRLHEAVKRYGIEKIYASPSTRAMETAIYAKGNLDIDIEYVEDLKEMNMGDWEGKTLAEIRLNEPDNFKRYWETPHLFQKNTGEDFEGMLLRVRRALAYIRAHHEQGNILVVTHGVTLKGFMSEFSEEGFSAFWKKPVVEQTSISLVRWVKDEPGKIILYGDTEHFIEKETRE